MIRKSMHLKVLLLAVLLLPGFSVPAQETPEGNSRPPSKANPRPDAGPEPEREPFDAVPLSELAKCVSLDTAKGRITLEMFPETAPNTVRNFLNLAAIGALRNTTFSRVVPGFVIQGGNLYSNPDLNYEMSMRARRNIPDEPNLVRHERGIVSMARTDEANSATTDFFILVSDAPSLDNKFASFGRVVEGMEVVDTINKMPVDEETPKEPVTITEAAVADCDIKPRPAPKISNLAEYGLRGNVRSVRESISALKGKRRVWDKSDLVLFEDILTEFGEVGDFVMSVVYKREGSKAGTITRQSMIPSPGEPPTVNEFFKDPQGTIISQAEMIPVSQQTIEFKSYDGTSNLIRSGVIEINENGRVLNSSYDRFAKDEKPDGKFTNSFTYDAYGFVTTHVQTDGSGKIVFYNRYEYTDFDDRGNWTERMVYESEKAKDAVASVSRKIEYYEN